MITGYQTNRVVLSTVYGRDGTTVTLAFAVAPWAQTVQKVDVDVQFSGVSPYAAAVLEEKIPALREELQKTLQGASLDATDWAGGILRGQVKSCVESVLPDFRAAVDLTTRDDNAAVQVVIYPVGELVRTVQYSMISRSIPNILLMKLKYKYADKAKSLHGLPVSYIESKYGSAVYEDIDTLSEKFNITCEINPLGFFVKEEQRRIYDSSQRQNEDYDTTATCDVVGTYRVLSSDDSRLQSGASFVGFEEYAAFPKPDSVNSAITFLDKIGNDYRFRLGDASLDPIATYHTLTNVFTLLMPSRSFCPESNNLYFSYAGVLKLLGYQTTINTDGQIDVTDADGIPVAVITKAAEGDMYVMHVTLAETGA